MSCLYKIVTEVGWAGSSEPGFMGLKDERISPGSILKSQNQANHGSKKIKKKSPAKQPGIS